MKNITRSTDIKMRTGWRMIMALLVLTAVSCSEDFLERKPKGQLTYDTFFETQDHAVWATNAVYQQYRSWEMCAFPWIGITDIISDDADKGSTPNDALYVLEQIGRAHV